MSKLLTENIAPCRSLFTFLFLLFTFSAVSFTAHAQSGATLSGVVQDQNAAAVAGASIIVQNKSTSLERTAETNEEGRFTVTFLPPGTYSVLVRRDGFTQVELKEITLNVADTKTVAVELRVGDVNGSVDVVADPFLINDGTSVSTTIDRTFVGNLPLNGRSFQSLILLTPGVTVTTSANAIDTGQFSVNGQRPSSNYVTVDGVSANIGVNSGFTGGATNLSLAGAYPGTNAFGGTTNLVSQEALEEFKIQTSSYGAELGRQPGGQIQLVTRSGSNDWHWSAFEYFRNEALDARSYFNFKPQPQAALRQNMFGATLGGPLPFLAFGDGGGPVFRSGKDKTFFFFSYEGQRLRLPSSGTALVPSLRVRNQAHAAMRPILDAFPQPTGPEGLLTTPCPVPPAAPDPRCDTTTNRLFSGRSPFAYSISNPSSLDATSIRIDHRIGKSLSLFGRFNESPSESISGVYSKTERASSTRTLTLGATMILNAALTNDFRFNYSRLSSSGRNYIAEMGGSVPVDAPLLTGHVGNVAVNVVSSQFNTGLVADSYQRQLNLVDTVSWTKGAHQIKFGADLRLLSPLYGTQDNRDLAFPNEINTRNGSGSVIVNTSIPSRPRFTNFSAFVQDAWKASKRLTLDLGLRWELNPAPTEADGQVPQIVTGIVGTDVTNAVLSPPGTSLYKTYWTAFAPRIGAAYLLNDAAGRETVIRGGWGLFYDLGSGNAASVWPLRTSWRTPTSFCPVGTFPLTPACSAALPVGPLTLPTQTLTRGQQEDLKLPATMEWNLAVEQSFGRGQVLSVSYVAASGRDLLTTEELNPLSNVITGTRENPQFATILYTRNGPSSDYHSMQAQYRVRLRDRIQALVNYTWAHLIDEVSSDVENGTLERGNSNMDVRHNLSAAISYNLPTWRANRFTKALTSGWDLNAIVHAQTGQPVNVLGGSTVDDGIARIGRPDLVPGVPLYLDDPSVPGGRRFNSAAFAQPPFLPGSTLARQQGNFGRNVLRALPLHQVDVSLGRKLKFGEKFALQLKTDVFNVFNHPMFGGYGLTVNSPATFGVPFSTLNASLGGLSPIFQMGGPRSIQLSAKLTY